MRLLVIQYLQVDCYKGEDCMESFCKDLREHGMKIMNYKKNKK